MANVIEKAEELASAIQKSVEYTDYIRLQKEVQNDKELYEKLGEYRRRCFEVQFSDDVDATSKMENIRNEYSEILLNGRVGRFMNAEQAFCKLMREVNTKIMESIDQMDVSFIH